MKKLIADLNAQGFPINEVSDLYNEKYKQPCPCWLDLLTAQMIQRFLRK